MREITDAHVAEPGLAAVEVAAADDETAFAIQELLAARCAIVPAPPNDPGTRRARCTAALLLDPRQEPGS
ncbi:DUF6207 family protein [Streptomyces sp. NPDC102270]|uniref:DUF6207 family protein n=1 Tax=Streptomyces sp. NPDC102270 TaxID=3366150 RepID=UPI00380F1B15